MKMIKVVKSVEITHMIDSQCFDPLQSVIVCLNICYSSVKYLIFDAILQPRITRDQGYHFWPDRPTGTLRVDFRKLRNFCYCFHFARSPFIVLVKLKDLVSHKCRMRMYYLFLICCYQPQMYQQQSVMMPPCKVNNETYPNEIIFFLEFYEMVAPFSGKRIRIVI